MALHKRLASGAEAYMPGLYEPVLEALGRGWLGPSTPVATNFNAPAEADRGLPVSCFGIYPGNTIDGIFDAARIMANMTKHGGGIGIDVTPLEGQTSPAVWAQLYDLTASIVRQNKIRRGAVAVYLDIESEAIEEFLHAKTHRGDQHKKLQCNIGVKISDAFMERMLAGDQKARELFSKVLELRLTTGSPYLFFTDNANKLRPDCYKERGLDVKHSQLCSEILLHNSPDVAYSCVLSSLNLDKYDEWANYKWSIFGREVDLPMLGIYFLDAITEEFISKADKLQGFETAVKGAKAGRPLGLGIMGLHSLYMRKGLPFASDEARELNKQIARHMHASTLAASKHLAEVFGEPEWCKGSGLRNTHRIAVAPTISNSVLCNAVTPGVTPMRSNLYAFEGNNGVHVRRNTHLEAYNLSDEAWEAIRQNDGSVQNLPNFPEALAEVFKTGLEIDQLEVVRQAADRQDIWQGEQGQSLNLFFDPVNLDVNKVWQVHVSAWRRGLPTLYYIYGRSNHSKIATTLDRELKANWIIYGRDNCHWCKLSKELLDMKGINYELIEQKTGPVPVIYRGEERIGHYGDLMKHFQAEPQPCAACDG